MPRWLRTKCWNNSKRPSPELRATPNVTTYLSIRRGDLTPVRDGGNRPHQKRYDVYLLRPPPFYRDLGGTRRHVRCIKTTRIHNRCNRVRLTPGAYSAQFRRGNKATRQMPPDIKTDQMGRILYVYHPLISAFWPWQTTTLSAC